MDKLTVTAALRSQFFSQTQFQESILARAASIGLLEVDVRQQACQVGFMLKSAVWSPAPTHSKETTPQRVSKLVSPDVKYQPPLPKYNLWFLERQKQDFF